MSWIDEALINLSRQLYPNGRAFKMPADSIRYKLHTALNGVKGVAYEDAVSIQSAMIPDNAGFTEADALQWYRRFGLIYDVDTPLADKKAAIYQKMGEPRATPRGSASYLQSQLQLAGFDVYVYENLDALTPYEVFGALPVAMHGATQYGVVQYGQNTNRLTKIANYIEESKDALFDIGPTYRSTFYISGNPITTPAEVPASRKKEFRQLILQLKRAQCVGILNVDYV